MAEPGSLRIGNVHRADALACVAAAVAVPLMACALVTVVAFSARDAATLDEVIASTVPVLVALSGLLCLSAGWLAVRGRVRARRVEASADGAPWLAAWTYGEATLTAARRVWREVRRGLAVPGLVVAAGLPAAAAVGVVPLAVAAALVVGCVLGATPPILRAARTYLLDHASEADARDVVIWPGGVLVRGVGRSWEADGRPVDVAVGVWGKEPLLVIRFVWGRRRVHVPVPRDRLDDARKVAEHFGVTPAETPSG